MQPTTIRFDPEVCAKGANELATFVPGLTVLHPREYSPDQVFRSVCDLADALPALAEAYGTDELFADAPLLQRVTWRAAYDSSRGLLDVFDLALYPSDGGPIVLGDSPYPDEMLRFRPMMPHSSCVTEEEFSDFLIQELGCEHAGQLLDRLSRLIFLRKADGAHTLERPDRGD